MVDVEGKEAVRVGVCYDVGMSVEAFNRASAGPSSGTASVDLRYRWARDLGNR